MGISFSLNDLAKLTLIASDAAYFSIRYPVPINAPLAPLSDTPKYDIGPQYSVFLDNFIKATQGGIDAIGFKYAIYKNTSSNEVIVAFGGTDGHDPVDWTGNTRLGWDQWKEGRAQVFADLRELVNVDTKVIFTGQSLGGGLAQYAAYEWVQAKLTARSTDEEFLDGFNKANVNLTTFNAFG
jgi:hypothetical protein